MNQRDKKGVDCVPSMVGSYYYRVQKKYKIRLNI